MRVAEKIELDAQVERELRHGAWLASLEFEIASCRPSRVFTCADGRPLWLYRAPFTPPGRSSR